MCNAIAHMKPTLGQQIKKKRINQRISLRELATQVKVSPGTLSRIERDVTMTDMRDTTKEQLIKWLGLKTDTAQKPISKNEYNIRTFAKELAEVCGWKVVS